MNRNQLVENAVNILKISQLKGHNFVGGSWETEHSEEKSEHEPWGHSAIYDYHEPSEELIDKTVDGACAAFVSWKSTTVEKRLEILGRFAKLIGENKDLLSHIVAIESGKLLWEAEQEISVLGSKVDATKAAFDERASNITADTGTPAISVETEFKPLGVCVVLGPYNFPMHMMNGQIIPALLTGNTVICKPSEFGILSATAYTRIMQQAGIPDGVFNLLVGGPAVGETLVQHDKTDAVYFTGSASTGEAIRVSCAKKNKKCAIEAGGNSVLIVDSFQDVDKAVETCIQSTLWSAGQRCNCARHLLVTKKALEDGFLDKYIEAVSSIVPASEIDDSNGFYGVLRNERDKSRLLSHVENLIELGATILHGTSNQGHLGKCSMTPVILQSKIDDLVCQDEYMGPVVQVRIYDDVESAVSWANKIELRLTAGILTTSDTVKSKFRRDIEFGNLTVNCPTAFASGYASFGGLGNSGNFEPAGFLAVDFCVTGVSHFVSNDVDS